MTLDIFESRIIKIHTTYNHVDELPQIKNYYFRVLSKILLEKNAVIITIAPQKNVSIGYEINPFQQFRIGDSEFIVSEVINVSSSLLMEICTSDDFNLGLLMLIVGETINSLDLSQVLQCIHYKIGFDSLKYEIVRCENDGNDLYIYNSSITKNTVAEIV